jgi:uncharacterized protein (TIGR02246 family)
MIRIQTRSSNSAVTAIVFSVVLLLAGAGPAGAQQKEKKKKKDASVTDSGSANPIIPMTDEQQIEYMISEVLGAWQIGDSERMHKSYLESVTVVRGDWQPPILGWTNYEALYKQQRAQMQQVRMDRTNTYVKVNGNTAWACFQWDFSGVVGGNSSTARGQTTYVMVKKDNRWLIAHDHTSVVQSAQPQAPGSVAAPPKPSN